MRKKDFILIFVVSLIIAGAFGVNYFVNTKNVDRAKSQEEKDEALKKAQEYSNHAKPGSIAAKANMVKQYNEKNNK